MPSVPATSHVLPLHFFEVRDQLPVRATVKGIRIIQDAFGSEKRVLQIKR